MPQLKTEVFINFYCLNSSHVARLWKYYFTANIGEYRETEICYLHLMECFPSQELIFELLEVDTCERRFQGGLRCLQSSRTSVLTRSASFESSARYRPIEQYTYETRTRHARQSNCL